MKSRLSGAPDSRLAPVTDLAAQVVNERIGHSLLIFFRDVRMPKCVAPPLKIRAHEDAAPAS